jgi:hypothetical protein
MIYELDSLDLKLLKKCRKAASFIEDGIPLKDVLNEEDLSELVYLLITIIDTEQKENN